MCISLLFREFNLLKNDFWRDAEAIIFSFNRQLVR